MLLAQNKIINTQFLVKTHQLQTACSFHDFMDVLTLKNVAQNRERRLLAVFYKKTPTIYPGETLHWLTHKYIREPYRAYLGIPKSVLSQQAA